MGGSGTGRLPLDHRPQLLDRTRHVLGEPGGRLVDEVLVPGIGPRDLELHVRSAVRPILEGWRHDDLGRTGSRQQGAQREVVERPPIQQLLDDGVLAVHAGVDGADAPARRAARKIFEPMKTSTSASACFR